MEFFSSQLVVIVLALTQIIKIYIPKRFRPTLAVFIGAISDLLLVLPTEWITAIETAVGGGVVGLIATGLYKLLDNFTTNNSKILTKK